MDFTQFGQKTDFNPEDVLAGGNSLLPNINGAVLGILGYEEKENDSGWKAVSYELSVLDDGSDGSLNGRQFRYQITVANPLFPESADWGFDELKRWAAALGKTSLTNANDLVGGQFSCNIGRKPQKKDPSQFNQTIKQVKPVQKTVSTQNKPATQVGFGQPSNQGFNQGNQGGFQQGFPKQ